MRLSFKITILVCAAALSLCGCLNSRAEKDVPPDIELAISAVSATPFESVSCLINIKDFGQMKKRYDRIVWYSESGVAEDAATVAGALHTAEGGEALIYHLNISDCREGEHKITVKAYRDDVVVSQDSKTFTVKMEAKGDFLNVKWNGAGASDTDCCSYGMLPLKYRGGQLTLAHFADEKQGEYASLRHDLWSATFNGYPESGKFTEEEEQEAILELNATIKRLIDGLYGESSFRFEGDDIRRTDLTDEYEKLFTYKLNIETVPGSDAGKEYPLEIWETPASVICLVGEYNGGKPYRGRIIAQPKRRP